MISITIGILQTDRVREQWLEQHGDYTDMFHQLLGSADSSLKFIDYQCYNGEFPQDIDEVDGYLITGSRYSAYDDRPWIRQLGALIVELNAQQKKLVGICFGHQIIAHYLGGDTTHSDKGWGLGLQTIKCLPDENPENLPTINIRLSHQDQVTTLATGARIIGSNDFCPASICAIGNHILSFQGHPEFSEAYTRELIDLRSGKVDDALLQQFRQSLDAEASNEAIARWIVNFLKS